MTGNERWAGVFYVLALLIFLGMGGAEYYQRQEEARVTKIAQQEKELQTKVATLQKREAAVEKEKPLIAEMEEQMLQPEAGSYYAQVLLATVGVQRSTGAQFPNYSFAEAGAAGKFPRYGVSGAITGSEVQVFEFIRQLEQGPYRVQVTNVAFTTSAGATTIEEPTEPGAAPVITGGQASANVQFLYTAREPQKP